MMNARLLQNVWKLQRLSCVVQRINYQTNSKSYATTNGATLTNNRRNFDLLELNGIQKTIAKPNFSTARPAPKEKTINVEMLLDNLDAHYQLKGNLNYEEFGKLMELLEAQSETYNERLSPEQAHFLLRACGPLMPAQQPDERLKLFQRFWSYLLQHGQLTAQHYRTHLHVLQHNRTPLEDFRLFLQEIAKHHGDAAIKSSELYEDLLAVACYNGNMRQATEILAEMRAHSIALTESNFNALILGHGLNRDLEGSQTVIESMSAAGVQLSSETQTMLIMAYLENNAEPKAVELLAKFHQQFDVGQIMRMLHSALYVDMSADFVGQLVRELAPEYLSGHELPAALRNVCIALIHNGKLDTVATIVSSLPAPVFNENQSIDTFGVFLLHELFRAQIELTKIIEISRLLKESGKNTRALHIATEIAIRRSPPLALPILEELAKEEALRPHYFWPLLMYNFRRHGESGIIRTLQIMTNFKVDCDQETFKEYVLPRLSLILEDPERAMKILDDAGSKASQILTPIIANLLQQQKMDEVYKLIELYPTKLDVSQLVVPLTNLAVNVRATKRYQQYSRLLAGLVKKSDNAKVDFIGQLLVDMLGTQSRLRDDLPAFRRFIGQMNKFGLKVSAAASDVILAALQQHHSKDASLDDISKTLREMINRSLALNSTTGGSHSGASTSSFIQHPRDMSLDELECHLIELESKGLNARGVLRRLLQLCVRDGRLQRALEVKAKCEKINVQVSPGMLASIFDMYIKLKDLPKAEESFRHLQKTYPGFQIDDHKLIDLAALLVHEQQLEAAKQLLQERAASSRKVSGGDYVLKNVWNFLTNVANLAAAQTSSLPKERNLTREAFVFLQQLGYCRSHNTVLGPIVREYLLRGDLPAAIDEFRKLADQYKHTPLQFEMLSLIVKLCNGNPAEVERFSVSVDEAQNLLGELTATIAKVHGQVNMNSALLLAFAESGTDKQLRRLLINPEFRINQDLLLKNCEHLGQEGAVQTLLRLARGSRGLNHVVDEPSIYNMLLDKFANENNCDAALDLFDRLEADDELKISQEFLRSLVKLLRVNNREIPSNIALRAQVI